ncbi:serine/threonine protein kinase [Streptomyces sp. HNM0663]|uniref:Serine/threonine protein kinase n=1 Tax=Streptomyces chengmaiensis TaxID=3040919 RepID=A0ABT6HL87_9ACTN|nr:protein kinase [Streptomyces chengmaiensis]MDH2389503.1 serine/threonine protein kinase [Streptomyces chengmaiensis]
MDDYAGRVLADRYRLPLLPSDAYELGETPAFDTYSGHEVLVRQVPLPEVVEAEVLEGDGGGREAGGPPAGAAARRGGQGHTTRRPADPAVRRAVEAAQAAAQVPDHPRLDQVFDVFAEAGSLWIVSERVEARPLAALLAERPLSPYRAAEIASDVLTALRALHAHGWTHRNITVRTILICDDGRVVLTGLAAGAAEEALCGYAPAPEPGPGRPRTQSEAQPAQTHTHALEPQSQPKREPEREREPDPELERVPEPEAQPAAVPDVRAARAGAIAAYRAGAQAAARASEARRQTGDPDWWAQPRAESGSGRLPGQSGGHGAGPEGGPGHPGGGNRVQLAGSWHDGPEQGRESGPGPAPAGGARAALPQPRSHDGAERPPALPPPAKEAQAGRWEEVAAEDGARYRGPATPLAAERARQARIAVVGAVTERWAPEQAGPVHENWQLAAPVGPATDLWALGALLFRAVQGHAPYPEENAVELVQLVCAEPPAFAEECGPLRPVVESLLRQDPTERPDFEELRGWLRSLVRSAPEPDAGMNVVPVPSGPVDAARLPVVRRRGELVRRRRAGVPDVVHGRHRHRRDPHGGVRERGPRALGRTLLLLILLLTAVGIAYAVLFLPKAGTDSPPPGREPTQSSGRQQGETGEDGTGGRPSPAGPSPDHTAPDATPEQPPGAQEPQTSAPTGSLPDGYALRKDPEGFRIAVDEGWRRSPVNDAGQVRYSDGDFILIVVPGRDSVADHGDDPLAYQRDKERELQPFRDSSWASATGLRRVDVGRQAMAEGQFTWRDSSGREVYVRNLALMVDGRYHVIQVIGPEAQRDEVTAYHQQAAASYRVTR